MASSRRISTVITFHLPLITVMLINSSLAKELRPSDHGLEYQSPPPVSTKTSPEMKAFFKGSSSPSTDSTGVALPKAMNSNDTTWWKDGAGGGGGRDHVRIVMLVASLVCGVTGVALLIASAFIYVFRYQRRKSSASASASASSISCVVKNNHDNNVDNNNNSNSNNNAIIVV